jgi:hypothetical protein
MTKSRKLQQGYSVNSISQNKCCLQLATLLLLNTALFRKALISPVFILLLSIVFPIVVLPTTATTRTNNTIHSNNNQSLLTNSNMTPIQQQQQQFKLIVNLTRTI